MGRLARTTQVNWMIFRVRWFGPYKLPEWWHASNVLLMWIKTVGWQLVAVKSWKMCVGEEQISPVHNFMYATEHVSVWWRNFPLYFLLLFLSFDLYVTREHKMTTLDSTGCGSLCLKTKKSAKSASPTQAHRRLWCFSQILNFFEKPKRWVTLENSCVDRF